MRKIAACTSDLRRGLQQLEPELRTPASKKANLFDALLNGAKLTVRILSNLEPLTDAIEAYRHFEYADTAKCVGL